jgi:endogenous inhibitor of DNA gyrase (YacG/DUF329 family)
MACPICKKPADMSKENRFRPFCSERCQMIDLGTWAGGDYKVKGGPGQQSDNEHPDDQPRDQIEELKKRRLLH